MEGQEKAPRPYNFKDPNDLKCLYASKKWRVPIFILPDLKWGQQSTGKLQMGF